ncbi:MAG: hypothetical protein BGP12_16610 [Rhodospirillales bacterium 70-18]|nr:EAL domain-containing protein [Rhodospirillales bacterium]OJY64146.1 MAG: hypothetical protein BGP12_16610 [Rhodospirillales bacterium 70-18]
MLSIPPFTDLTPPHPAFRQPTDGRADAAQRRRLKRELAEAVAQGALALHYQPRVSLRTGLPVGAEALARWPHRRRGLVPPGAFLPLAEEAGLMTGIGGWTLATACAEAALWPDGPSGARPGVSVNIAACQLADQALLGQVAAALERSGLAPERLELELGEATLGEAATAGGDLDLLLTLSAIRDLGVGLAVDNFGTGLASLSMLRRLPLTTMKLDRSLVRGVPEQAEDAAILRALVQAAHALGLCVVAEGVETEAQRAFLAGIGCDEAQGYLFAAPMPAERLIERLGG